MNKGGLTNNNDNKAHARKGKVLVEFNAKKYFSNLAENPKFTFYNLGRNAYSSSCTSKV